MATIFNDTTADHKWSTVANWSDGKPDSADDVTINSAVTSLIIDEDADCKGFDATGTSGITISGGNVITVWGNFKLDSNVVWTQGSHIYLRGTTGYTFNSGGVLLSSIIALNIISGGNYTLNTNPLNLGSASLLIYNNSTQFNTNNLTVTCGKIGDAAVAGSPTITLGSSTINCTYVDFGWSTPTISSSGATVVCDPGANSYTYKFKVDWGNAAISIKTYNTKISTLSGACTLGSLTLTKDSGTATVKFPSGVTTTVGAFAATDLILTSSDGASQATLSDSAGTNAVTGCTLSYLNAAGGATWNAFTSDGNTDGGNNTGWNFSSTSIPVMRNHYTIMKR